MTATVVLVEDDPTGHRLGYAGVVARAALARGHRVVLALPSGAETTPEARLSVPDGVRVVPLPGGRTTAAAVADVAARAGADRTFVLSADDLVASIARGGWAGPGELSLLVMRPRSQRAGAAAAALTAVKLLLRTAVRARGVRVRVLTSAVAAGSGPLQVRDPIRFAASEADVSAFRAAADLDRTVRWVAVVGVIAARKHVPLVARAIEGLPAVGLLLAGRVDPAERAAVDHAEADLVRAGHPVRRVERLLADEEFDAAIAAVDLVVVAHGNEGASGVLGKAAAAGTPLILAGARSLAVDARRLPQLVRWVPLDAEALREAIAAPSGGRPAAVATDEEFARTLLGPGR